MHYYQLLKFAYASLPLHCSSCDWHSVLMYKYSKFLVEILDLLVFVCLCHAFHKHTLSQHDPLGHLHFLLNYTQCIHLYLPKEQMEVQTTWMYTYGCYFPLSHTQVLDLKKLFFYHSDCEKRNKHSFSCAFSRSNQIIHICNLEIYHA